MFIHLADQMEFDSGTLNLCRVDKGYRLPDLQCFLFREPASIGPNYQKTSHLDSFGPVLLNHPSKSFDGLDFFDPDQWHEHPFYLHHCRHFDVENALAVAASLPGHLKAFLVLYLFQATPGRKFLKEEVSILDREFPHLFNMWLYRLGFICAETLAGRLILLDQFQKSPGLLRLIKLVVQDPMASSKEYAKTLAISERTVEHELKKIYDKLEIGGLGKNKKAEVFRRFHFLNG